MGVGAILIAAAGKWYIVDVDSPPALMVVLGYWALHISSACGI